MEVLPRSIAMLGLDAASTSPIQRALIGLLAVDVELPVEPVEGDDSYAFFGYTEGPKLPPRRRLRRKQDDAEVVLLSLLLRR